MRKLLVSVAVVLAGASCSGQPIAADNPSLGGPSPVVTEVVKPDTLVGEEADTRLDADYGTLVGRITVPRLGLRDFPIRMGVGDDVLAGAVGTYIGSARPGLGNVTLAGHRVTPVIDGRGPFRYLDKLRLGDRARLTYKGVVYRFEFARSFVVRPHNTSVLADDAADLTMTACTPLGSDAKRIIAWWRLI